MKISKKAKRELTICILELIGVVGMFALVGFGILYKLCI